jgi:hypothetical protein
MHQSLPSWILSSHPAHLVGRSRYWLLALISFLLISVSARGEWITLQIPLARSGHAFELWEDDGIQPDQVTQTPAPLLLNGYYDSQGNWRPLATSYARVQVERKRAGDFWLKDVNTGTFGPANQVALVNAEWRDTNGETAMRYFVLPESLIGHTFVVQYPGGETFNVTTGQAQGFYDDDNQFVSFGYFEAWSERLPGVADTGWRIVDCLLELEGPVHEENLIGADWFAFSGSLQPYQVDLILRYDFTSSGQTAGESFTLYIEGGAAQSGVSWHDTNYDTLRFSGSVPQGSKYWLVRNADQKGSPHLIMGGANAEIDVSASFPPIPQPNNVEYYFSLYGYTPSDLTVHYTDGTSGGSLTWAGETSVSHWDEYGNESPAFIYYPYASIDQNKGGWTIKDAGNNVLGQGPDFYSPSWPTGNWQSPSGEFYATFVGDRASHEMKIQDGSGLWTFTEYSTGITGGYFGPNGEYVEWPVSFRSAPSGGNSVYDNSRGDSISGTNTENWFVPLNLALQISATRLGHDLRIRTGNGQEFPVTAHNVQGYWDLDGPVPVFNSYGYFDASASSYSDFPWWLLDYSQLNGGNPHVIGSSASGTTNFLADVDERDTDGDTWADWYERLVGTNPNAVDTDGDGTPDNTDPNPRALPANTSTATLRVYTPLE